jgi:hypothetical protein
LTFLLRFRSVRSEAEADDPWLRHVDAHPGGAIARGHRRAVLLVQVISFA